MRTESLILPLIPTVLASLTWAGAYWAPRVLMHAWSMLFLIFAACATGAWAIYLFSHLSWIP